MESPAAKPFPWLVLILTNLGSLLLGLVFSIYLQKSQATSPIPVTPTPSSFLSQPADTSSWLTYAGETPFKINGLSGKFTIKYPSNWLLRNNKLYPFGDSSFSNSSTLLILGAQSKGESSHPGRTITKQFPGGYAYYTWEATEKDAVFYQNSYDYAYIFEFQNVPEDQSKQLEATFNQILSTFKITSPTNIPVPTVPSDWKTYTNSNYKFQYPASFKAISSAQGVKIIDGKIYESTSPSGKPLSLNNFDLALTFSKTDPNEGRWNESPNNRITTLGNNTYQVYFLNDFEGEGEWKYVTNTSQGYYVFNLQQHIPYAGSDRKLYADGLFDISEANLNTTYQILSTFTLIHNISTWQTYKSPNGYSLKYPSYLTVTNKPDSSSVSFSSSFSNPDTTQSNIDIGISTYPISSTENLKNWIANYVVRTHPDDTKKSMVQGTVDYSSFNGHESASFVGGVESFFKFLVIKRPDSILVITLGGQDTGSSFKDNPNAEKLFDQVLSTLKFNN